MPVNKSPKKYSMHWKIWERFKNLLFTGDEKTVPHVELRQKGLLWRKEAAHSCLHTLCLSLYRHHPLKKQKEKKQKNLFLWFMWRFVPSQHLNFPGDFLQCGSTMSDVFSSSTFFMFMFSVFINTWFITLFYYVFGRFFPPFLTTVAMFCFCFFLSVLWHCYDV